MLVGAVEDSEDADAAEATEKDRWWEDIGWWGWSWVDSAPSPCPCAEPSPSTRSASAFRRGYSALFIEVNKRVLW